MGVRLSARLGQAQSTETDQHHKPTRKGGRFETEQADRLRRSTMTHDEARDVIMQSDAFISVDEDAGRATIEGELTIKELHAVLQLLEYKA